MGASNFVTTGWGQNIYDAYKQVCKDAEREYGTDPYNGTISTTSGIKDMTMQMMGSPSRKKDVATAIEVFTDRLEKRGPAGGIELMGYQAEKFWVRYKKQTGQRKPRGAKAFVFFGWAAS